MKSLRLRISLIILVLMVTSSVLIAWIAISNAKKSLEKEMTQALVESVHATANSIQAMNDKEYKMLETLASLTDVKDPEVSLLDKCHIIYGAMSTNTDYIDVCILDTDGFAWINDGVRKVPFKERKYFQEPLRKGTRFETDAFINKVTNAPAIFYSVPVYDKDKNIINVLFCVIDGLRLSELVVSHKAGDNRPASVISLSGGAGGENEAYSELHASGIVIAAESLLDKNLPLEKFATENIFDRYDSKKNPGIKKELERIKTEQSGVIKYKDGEQYIMAFERVPNANWAIINTIPYSDFQNDINSMRKRIIIYVLIVVLISVLIVGFIISRSMKPLDTVKKAITDIATGNADLTKRIMIHSDDEIGAVVRGFNRFGEKLHRIISDIKISKEKLAEVGNNMSLNAKETADSITEVYSNIEEMQRELVTQGNSVQNTTSAVKEISSDIGTLEKLIETQSEGISQASSAIEQMIGNISSVNKSVENMAGSFEALLKSTENGVGKQKTVGNKIKEIENKSAELKGANLVISEIATQTNLLAMNAAIEAAHAGDAGKGFSVVASEIKKLSENSQRESDKISDQLGSIIKSIEEVVAASNEATGALKQVSSLIDTTNDIVRQIRFAMEEQTSGSKEIGDALHTMNDTTSEVRRASVKMTTGNEFILEEIKNLQEATETMKVSMDKIISGADKINRSGNELNQIAPEMKSSIDRISSQIDEFKV